jgi:CheY-like chemotaxis protein
VLAIDDNPTNRAIVESHLRAWGFRVESVASGAIGLEVLRAEHAADPFALVVLDMQMPDMDGLQVAKAIREDPALAPLPLVMLTSMALRERAQELKEAGFAAWLTKPVRPLPLYNALVGVLTGPEAAVGSATPTIPEAEALPALPPMRVLVAEDNSVNQKVAVRILAKLGARADAVGNGLEALEALARVPYDVVLMDVQMPEMDGLEATRELRRREAGTDRHTPVIAMTAHAMARDRDRCLAAGMDDHLTKPIRPQSLAASLLCWTVGRAEVAAERPAVDDGIAIEFDPHQFEDASGGDEAFARALVDEFMRAAPDTLRQAIDAEANGDFVKLAAAAHTLAGGCSMLGAVRLSTTCMELQDHAETGDRAAARSALDQAQRDLGALKEHFETMLMKRAA